MSILAVIIITASLTALACYIAHSIQIAKATVLLARACETIEFLRNKTAVVDEAIDLLERQRFRTQYRQDDQIKTQEQVARFIKEWKR